MNTSLPTESNYVGIFKFERNLFVKKSVIAVTKSALKRLNDYLRILVKHGLKTRVRRPKIAHRYFFMAILDYE